MEGLLILGLLIAGIAGGPPAPPQALGPPVRVEVDLVSLRLEPSGSVPPAVSGYLHLTADVQDSPALPVETLERQGSRVVLPGTGLIPHRFHLASDGRWHVPKLKERWRTSDLTGRGAPGYARAVLTVYPDRQGWARVQVTLYLDGTGWHWPTERVTTVPVYDVASHQLFFDTPYGRVGVYLRFRPFERI